MNQKKHVYVHVLRNLLFSVWSAALITILYTYFFQPDFFQHHLATVLAAGAVSYLSYFTLCCLRGFTLIPATYLTIAGMLFFPPLPLFILTLLGILFSALCIYHFSDSFHLYTFFEQRHKKGIQRIKQAVDKNELFIVILWNILAIVPADLISYVCGILKTDRDRFILGTLIGQGAYSAVLIFLPSYVMKLFA
ncbi:MAG: VTT domain-containing protein [Patescibacteria group bacterium]